MDEAQHLANRVAVMNSGEIIAVGKPEELGGRDLRPSEIRFTLPAGWSLGDLPDMPAAERSLEGDRVLIATREPVRAAHVVTTWALEHDIDLGHFSVSQPTLEDIYLQLTGSGQDQPIEVVR
jgi:ABC-2 type transport system ATP-binding protein